MLPKITELEFEEVIDRQDSVPEIGKSFLYDFKTGDFVLEDGKFVEVEGDEALKLWIANTIKTERFKYRIYKDIDHGAKTEDLIGKVYHAEFLKSELKREITEALISHPQIQALKNWSVTKTNDKLIVYFDVVTSQALLSQEVILGG